MVKNSEQFADQIKEKENKILAVQLEKVKILKSVDPLKETIKLRDETIVDYEERLALMAQDGHKILEIADELKKT